MKNIHQIKNKTTNKNFGLFFSLIFLIITLFIYFLYETLNIYFLSISIILVLISLFYPNLLSIPNFLWFKFGILLNKIFSPIVLSLMYLVFFIPLGLIFKLFKIDILKQKINPNAKTYWEEKKNNYDTSFKNQY
tara:strand:- start:461 stop:862 length:402 start_codon:yes stop_codon:yes gene_type:complete